MAPKNEGVASLELIKVWSEHRVLSLDFMENEIGPFVPAVT